MGRILLTEAFDVCVDEHYHDVCSVLCDFINYEDDQVGVRCCKFNMPLNVKEYSSFGDARTAYRCRDCIECEKRNQNNNEVKV